MKLIYALLLLLPTFQLGMTVKEAESACPHALATVYLKLHTDTHLMCDDGRKTTVLIFDKGKLSAIVDLKYFSKNEGM